MKFLLVCYIYLIFWSAWEMKFNFESNTTPMCFWLGHLAILILLNLIGGWEKFAESD